MRVCYLCRISDYFCRTYSCLFQRMYEKERNVSCLRFFHFSSYAHRIFLFIPYTFYFILFLDDFVRRVIRSAHRYCKLHDTAIPMAKEIKKEAFGGSALNLHDCRSKRKETSETISMILCTIRYTLFQCHLDIHYADSVEKCPFAQCTQLFPHIKNRNRRSIFRRKDEKKFKMKR